MIIKNNSLVIMAGGASSRMKRSLGSAKLPAEVMHAAKYLHKSLIPLGDKGQPLLYYLLKNAVAAGITRVYLITSPENEAFVNFMENIKTLDDFAGLEVSFAIQFIPTGREKPLGTADALQQCLEQHQNLLEENFTVCNGDNLYSREAFEVLKASRTPLNALIAYDGDGLGHSQEKITKFALLDFSQEGLLTNIIEKPTDDQLADYHRKHDNLWVSMNIFNFHGGTILPFLEECPIHPERGEKELPEAVRNMVHEHPQSLLCITRSEKIPDLTSANDIATFFE
jgi:NDP-sugar pyrophosphorylase family protein